MKTPTEAGGRELVAPGVGWGSHARLLVIGLVLAAACARAPAPAVVAVAAPAAGAAPVAANPTTPEGCRACQGAWGQHGITPEARCLCRMADAGRPCRDGSECQGQCVADAGDTEITDPGPPRMGYFLGRCSEYAAAFGCHRIIDRGAVRAGPVNLEENPPRLCVD